MILNCLLFLLIGVCMYSIVQKISISKLKDNAKEFFEKKNEKYYSDLLKYYDKNKKVKFKNKINYFKKVNILIDRCGMQRNMLINPISVIFAGVLCVCFAYTASFGFFKIIMLSLIISIPFFYLPFFILSMIAEYKEEKIEKVFLNFLLQLKNHTRINNDIISAMSEVKTIEPLQEYVKKFLVQVSSGTRLENAIQDFKEKVSVKQMKSFLTNVEHCFLYGGNFSELIDKSYIMISEIQEEKKKRIEETKSARIVLFILILLDIIVYVSFIKSNVENYKIMTKSVIGNLILYWNFISMWLLVWISIRVKKLDY